MKDYKKLKKIEKIEWQEETPTYGKLLLEPLEKGFGITVGNSLRRMLLSSVPGAAVIAVKIEGVLHPYSTIPGVVEDVINIILNLKKLAIRLNDSAPLKLYLEAKGAAEVTAKDIRVPYGVEIINKDLHIATLEEDGKLYAEIEVDHGYGYVPKTVHKKGEGVVGVMPVDAFFSPVKRANFTVQELLSGAIGGYERLILEVWTDGTVSPKEAINIAVRNLQEVLEPLITFKPQEKPFIEYPDIAKLRVEREHEQLRQILSTPLEQLELSGRIFKKLKEANLHNVADLVQCEEEQLLGARNLGPKSIKELKEKLQFHGLSLGMRDLVLSVLGEEAIKEKIEFPAKEPKKIREIEEKQEVEEEMEEMEKAEEMEMEEEIMEEEIEKEEEKEIELPEETKEIEVQREDEAPEEG